MEFNGINPTEMTTEGTSFGDGLSSGIPIARKDIPNIVLRGFLDTATGSAFGRIGRSAGRVDYPSRTLTVTHATGLSQAIEVVPIKNNIGPELDGVSDVRGRVHGLRGCCDGVRGDWLLIHVDVKVDLSGIDRLEAKLKEAADKAALAMATAGHDDSQVLVPVDTGALRRSGVVDVQKKGSAEAVVQYGGKSHAA